MQYDYSILTKTIADASYEGKNVVYCIKFNNNNDNNVYYYIGSKKSWHANYYGSISRGRSRKIRLANQYLDEIESGSKNLTKYILDVVDDATMLTTIELHYQKLFKVKSNKDFVNAGYANNYKGYATKGLTCIIKDSLIKYVLANELNYWISNGWSVGSSTSNKVCVTNGYTNRYFESNEASDFLQENADWYRGNKNSGTIVAYKDVKKLRIPKEQARAYERAGWSFVNTSRTKTKLMYKDNLAIRVNVFEVDTYINDGWTLGIRKSNMSGRIIVNNGITNKAIFPEELKSYEESGWIKAKLKSNKNV